MPVPFLPTRFLFGAAGLAMLTACAHGASDEGAKAQSASQGPVTSAVASPLAASTSRRSARPFGETVTAAKAAIDKRGFKTFAVIDHAKGAASIDAVLNPTTLIIFGNPKGGTPLMQESQTAGLDLPLKMLVIERSDGAVDLVWTPMQTIAARHAITGQSGRIEKVSGALRAIAAEASSIAP